MEADARDRGILRELPGCVCAVLVEVDYGDETAFGAKRDEVFSGVKLAGGDRRLEWAELTKRLFLDNGPKKEHAVVATACKDSTRSRADCNSADFGCVRLVYNECVAFGMSDAERVRKEGGAYAAVPQVSSLKDKYPFLLT